MKKILAAFVALLSLAALTFCQRALAGALILPADLTAVEAEAFYGDQSLAEVTLPEGLESIGRRAFAGCGLSEVYLPESLSYIARDAFDGPDKVTVTAEMYSYAYRWAVCYGYIVPFTLEENGDGTLTITGYTADDEAIIFPDMLYGKVITGIGEGAIRDNTALYDVVLPIGLTRIGDEAFFGCSNLYMPDFPLGLREIGDRAFYGVDAFILELPRSLTHIGDDAFTDMAYINTIKGTYADRWAHEMSLKDDISVISIRIANIDVGPRMASPGDEVTCSVARVDNRNIGTVHWQVSLDGERWTDCEGPGADTREYAFAASDETGRYLFRLACDDFTGTYYSDAVSVNILDDGWTIDVSRAVGTDISLSWGANWKDVLNTLYMTGPDGIERVPAEDTPNSFCDVTDLAPESAYIFRVEARIGENTA